MYLSSLQLNDLIPMESNDACLRKSQKRIVIGHNVGFDRSFIKEQYFLEVKIF
jgi:DNA polymerase gamma 1